MYQTAVIMYFFCDYCGVSLHKIGISDRRLKSTLDRTDINKDGNLDVLDLGAVLKTYPQKSFKDL